MSEEKEPIINGIDVSECTYSKIGIDEKCYCEQDLYDDGTPVFTCDECPDCYFKQLKRLQEENEKLKKKKDEYYLINLDYEAKISYLIQTLEKIKKWATNHNPCDIEAGINCTKEDCFECLNYDIKKITKIIDEVFNDRD